MGVLSIALWGRAEQRRGTLGIGERRATHN